MIDHSQGSFSDYKEKDIWKRAFNGALRVIETTKKFPRSMSNDIIARQMIRSATSIGANLSEASAAISRKEFHSFVNIARREAIETDYWLRICYQANIVDKPLIESMGKEYQEIVKILSSIAKQSIQ